jgi:ParB-like chromosome segregation protein Spo0J
VADIRSGPYQALPDLTPEAFAALKADIAERGVITPIDVDEEGVILDGHHRWRAHCESGRNEPPPVIVRAGLTEAEKMSFARRQNILRRHMSRREVRRVVETELRSAPGRSDRAIAAVLGVDHKTVAAARRSGEFPTPAERRGLDGKIRPAPPPRPSAADPAPDTPEAFAKAMLGSAEAVRANAERIAALPDDLKLALFNAGLSASSTVVVMGGDGPPHGLGPHEVAAFEAFGDYLAERGWTADAVGHHLEWLVRNGWRSPDEWLGEEGRKYRARFVALSKRGHGWPEPSPEFVEGWRHRRPPAPSEPETPADQKAGD